MTDAEIRTNVMKSVYRHALNEDEARKSVVNDFSFL